VQAVLNIFAQPEVGLVAIFVLSLLAATLLPMGSEPALLGYVALAPDSVWPAIGVATLGNTLGGVLTFWMGACAQHVLNRANGTNGTNGTNLSKPTPPGRWRQRAEALAQRFGAPILLFSWVPLIGDPLCAVAGWLRLPFLPCLIFMALGKFTRYAILCGVLLELVSPIH
jgi:membrane protein YqaA with SNARE-associated domain